MDTPSSSASDYSFAVKRNRNGLEALALGGLRSRQEEARPAIWLL